MSITISNILIKRYEREAIGSNPDDRDDLVVEFQVQNDSGLDIVEDNASISNTIIDLATNFDPTGADPDYYGDQIRARFTLPNGQSSGVISTTSADPQQTLIHKNNIPEHIRFRFPLSDGSVFNSGFLYNFTTEYYPLSNGIANGYKGYRTLEEYDILTGNPTGQTKPNVPGDPDYVHPIYDPTSCPVG